MDISFFIKDFDPETSDIIMLLQLTEYHKNSIWRDFYDKDKYYPIIAKKHDGKIHKYILIDNLMDIQNSPQDKKLELLLGIVDFEFKKFENVTWKYNPKTEEITVSLGYIVELI